MMKSEKRKSEWAQLSTDLTNNALSLCVGWGWSNFTSVACTRAVATSGMKPMHTYLICCIFTWAFISVLHRKFESERSAWDSHVEEE
eukprot:CAMPEP_0177561554 /NCGR_PEP_ID=MMETSP0369-20130122/72004_1 /TAXON_ID=447022 ORGANISM="Scrippsiella hangoei-like, Strain SHHI-4" /NCGR_SAMPLE_ID=MMETSP0369 /ASSEMBLY_ACC=CAM_ASM_000364 /LENGTH=86 /DNA_ID=CAMNT_0019048503 /DNA_START=36 /DNA_END=293 /DNA_ORIENTATION=+